MVAVAVGVNLCDVTPVGVFDQQEGEDLWPTAAESGGVASCEQTAGEVRGSGGSGSVAVGTVGAVDCDTADLGLSKEVLTASMHVYGYVVTCVLCIRRCFVSLLKYSLLQC